MDTAVQAGYAYIGKGTRLLVLDISKPQSPQLAGSSADMPDIVQAVAVDGHYAYAADGGGGLWIFDISKPESPTLLSTYAAWASGIAVTETAAGRFAYLTDGDLHILDVTDPANPLEKGFYQTPGYTSGVVVKGNLAYLADGENGLLILDLSDPAQPKQNGILELSGYAYNLALVEDLTTNRTYIYTASGDEGGVRVVDVSDAAHPVETGFLRDGMNVRDLAVWGARLLAANGEHGLAILNVAAPDKLTVLGSYDSPGFALGVAVQDGSAYLADGAGLLTIDLDDPANPKQISSYDVLGAAYSVALQRQSVDGEERTYAYVADYYSGMYVMDVSTPLQRPTVTGFYDAPGYTHSVMLSEPNREGSGQAPGSPLKVLAYLSGPLNGLRLVDASSPYYPHEVGAYEQTIAAENPAAFPFQFTAQDNPAAHTPAFVYIAEGQAGGLRIVDVSNPRQPVDAGFYALPSAARAVVVQSMTSTPSRAAGARLAEGAEEKQKARLYAFIAAGENGLQVVDVTDPANPFAAAEYDTPGYASSVALSGNYAYIADGADAGLQIVDVSQPEAPRQAGALAFSGDAVALTVAGSRVFVANGSAGVRVVDVSDATHPLEIASYPTPGFANSVAVAGDMLYTACRGAGLVVLRFQKPNPLTLTVNSNADVQDAIAGDGECKTHTGVCSLRAAIQEANANSGVDTIVLPAGVYPLSLSGAEEDEAKSGDLDVRDHLILQGAGYETTILDGGALDRVLHLLGDGNLWVDISGVTIQNGLGGINVYQAGSFSLRNSQVTQNAGYGIWGVAAHMSLDGCLVSENRAAQFVGGVGNHLGKLVIRNSVIFQNEGADGGIFSDGELSVLNSTVSGNVGYSAAGGLRVGGKGELINSTVAQNSGSSGGGIASEGNLTLQNSLVAENSASVKSPDCSGKIISLGHNLISNPTGFVVERAQADLLGVEAKLAPLTQVEGLGLIHPLQEDSPAFQAGDAQVCASLLQGYTNPPECNIGALELFTATPTN